MTSPYFCAVSAIKDILFMYRELISYGSFFDDFSYENGTFDPFFYIDFDYKSIDMDLDSGQLLHRGSAVKIYCQLLQLWGQGALPEAEKKLINDVRNLIDSGRIDHLPDFKEGLDVALYSNDSGWALSDGLYIKYVKNYFHDLSYN